MKFQDICLYETGKVAVSARVIGSDVRWRRIFHESIHVSSLGVYVFIQFYLFMWLVPL